MVKSEASLLKRFATRRDAVAFGEIVRRHGPMVHGACMRVLANRDLAAEATQETFYQLIERARQITESVPAWLHRVATRKAIDLLRSESARTRREAKYAANRAGEVRTWQDLSEHIDEALEDLYEQKRRLLIEHFFEGKTMAQIGRQMNLSRPTISGRIEEAVNVMREQLRKRGLICVPAALGGLLAEGRAEAMPRTLTRELGKMAIAGSQAAAGGSAAASGLGGTVVAIKTKAIAGVAVAVIAAVGIHTLRQATRPQHAPPPQAGNRAPPSQSFWKTQRPEDKTQEPIEESVSEENTPPPEKTTQPPVQQIASPDEIDRPVEDRSQDQISSEWTGPDLRTPQSTARSFMKAMITSDPESALACLSPDSEDYANIERAFYGDPNEEDQAEFGEIMRYFGAFDPDADMPIVELKDVEGGVTLTIQVTFQEDFAGNGRTYRDGDTYDIPNITLRPFGDKWLIDDP